MLTTITGPDRSVRTRSSSSTSDARICIAPFHTRLNWMAIAWRDDMLLGNVFGYASRRSAELALARIPRMPQTFCRFSADGQDADVPQWVSELSEKLRRFAEGEPVDFDKVRFVTDHLTRFGQHVVAACRRIPRGLTRTYGELASECGSPGAARAVGSVMAKNRYPLIVPCHRVLAAGGELGGYTAPDGVKMKRRLLLMEGRAV